MDLIDSVSVVEPTQKESTKNAQKTWLGPESKCGAGHRAESGYRLKHLVRSYYDTIPLHQPVLFGYRFCFASFRKFFVDRGSGGRRCLFLALVAVVRA